MELTESQQNVVIRSRAHRRQNEIQNKCKLLQ